MRRRAELHGLVLLSTVWAWLVFVVMCGTVAPRFERLSEMPRSSECCAHPPANDPCDAPACAMTCAALFTVALSEPDVAVAAPIAVEVFLAKDEVGRELARQPPVPPPKAWV